MDNFDKWYVSIAGFIISMIATLQNGDNNNVAGVIVMGSIWVGFTVMLGVMAIKDAKGEKHE